MSLIQCEKCGCLENTALTSCCLWGPETLRSIFDWTGLEEYRGKKLCSACGPAEYNDSEPSGLGEWHGKFDRLYLPKGKFFTNGEGNLEHKETGLTNVREYALESEEDEDPISGN